MPQEASVSISLWKRKRFFLLSEPSIQSSGKYTMGGCDGVVVAGNKTIWEDRLILLHRRVISLCQGDYFTK
jgi:hypothetical protein